MPRTHTEIEALLDRLEEVSAHGLESESRDFKEWDARRPDQSVRTVVGSAVCMANGGGEDARADLQAASNADLNANRWNDLHCSRATREAARRHRSELPAQQDNVTTERTESD